MEDFLFPSINIERVIQTFLKEDLAEMPQFLKKAVASALFLFLHLVFYRDILILFLVTGGKALFCRAFYFPSFFQPYHGVQKIPVAGLQGLFRLLIGDVCSFS